MRKRAWIFGCLLLAFLSMHAQSAWRILPEKAEVDHKKLRNTFVSSLYNDELQIEQIKVVNNRALLLQLRCPSHSLEYRSKVSIKRIGKSILYKSEPVLHFHLGIPYYPLSKHRYDSHFSATFHNHENNQSLLCISAFQILPYSTRHQHNMFHSIPYVAGR